MKPFNTLTNQELADLTDDQIKEYLDYACAEEGLPLDVSEPVAPEPMHHETNLLLTEIPAVIVDRDVGNEIMAILDSTVQYGREYDTVLIQGQSNTYKVLNSGSYNYASGKFLFGITEERAAQTEAQSYSLRKQWEEYHDQKAVYDHAIESRTEKIKALYDQISSARALLANKERMLAEWGKYLTLADNDRGVAERFFVERYSQRDFTDVVMSNEE
jgi:hypothetical protein